MPSTSLIRTVVALALVAAGCSISRPDAEETAPFPPAPSPAPIALTLESGSIGPFSFGETASIVIDGISAVIGGPDVDSLDDATVVQLPDCPGTTPRVVAWGSLALVFTGDPDGAVFTSWSYGFDPLTGNSQDLRRLELVTATGIGLGSTRSALIDAYGDAVSIIDEPSIDSALFTIATDETPHLSGKLDAAGPDGVVDLLQTEPTC